jgi:hypothetical protein
MSTINVGTISQNVNTVTINGDLDAAAAPARALFLNFQGGTLSATSANLRFSAGKIGSGGRAFDVTVTVNRPLGATTVGINGQPPFTIQGIDIVPGIDTFDVVVHLILDSFAPRSDFVLTLNGLENQPVLSGTAEYTRITGPFAAPAPIAWSLTQNA